MPDNASPQRILDIGYGYWSAKTLLSANELGLFTVLDTEAKTSEQLTRQLELHPRGARALFDALVGLGLLDREGDDLYRNTPEAAAFLVKGRENYVGDLLDLLNSHMWQAWGGLSDMVLTGRQQNDMRDSDSGGVFDVLYGDPELLEVFLTAMSGFSAEAAKVLATAFPWERHRTVMDIGTAQGLLPVTLARAHDHLTVGGFDLPQVGPVFEDFVAKNGLADRVSFRPGDFFTDELPPADVLVLGHVLHNWGLADKKMLLAKAYDAIPAGGALVVYETIIDDDRRANLFGMLMNLAMMVDTRDGFDYTGAECRTWMQEAGFPETSVTPLTGSHSMVVGRK